MRISLIPKMAAFLIALGGAFASHDAPQGEPAAPLNFEFFKARVQPIFLARRPGHARCYACHSQGTNFRLQRLSPGATAWNDEQSRRNLEATERLVVPGDPLASRLLTHPLAPEAGGDRFHSGGKHWDSQDDPEWRTLVEWVRGHKPDARQ